MLVTKLGSGFILSLLLLSGTLGWSQVDSTRKSSIPTASVFVGYSYLPENFISVDGSTAMQGWDASVSANVTRKIAVVVDFSQGFTTYNLYGGQHDTSNIFTFMAGPRVFIPIFSRSPLKPFVEILGGGAHIAYKAAAINSQFSTVPPFKNSVSGALALGGGLDYRLYRHLSVRGQAGYLLTRFTTEDNQFQRSSPSGHLRVSSGVAYSF